MGVYTLNSVSAKRGEVQTPIPYFDSELPDVTRKNVNEWRQEVSTALDKLIEFWRDMFGVCHDIGLKNQRHEDMVLLGFARHILAYLDCVRVLLGHGCSEGCTPLLRSILEAHLGIAHIVKDRSEERSLGLAQQ